MYWLRRIPAETRIVVLVVFLALFQSILLSVIGLGAIRGERRQFEEKIRDAAKFFLQQYVVARCQIDLSQQAVEVFSAAFDRRDPDWRTRTDPPPGRGIFTDAYSVLSDGWIVDAGGATVLLPRDAADEQEEAAREGLAGLRRRFATGDLAEAEKSEQDLAWARRYPFARDEFGHSVALLLAASPLLLGEGTPDVATLLRIRWIGVLNRLAGFVPEEEVERFLERVDAAAAGDEDFAARRREQNRRALVVASLQLDAPRLTVTRRPALHRGFPADSRRTFYVRPIGSSGDIQVLAVDPGVLREFLDEVARGAREQAGGELLGLEPRIVEGVAADFQDDPASDIEGLPGFAAVARIKPEMVQVGAGLRERFYWWIIGFSITGILAGGFLTARVVMREVKLAKLKSGFVSNISHELKTPLTSIRMFVEMLQSGKVEKESERAECLGVIGQESERLGKLIQQVLDFGRLDARQRRFRWVTGSLQPLLEREAERFRRATGLDAERFSLRTSAELPPVAFDPEAFAEVVTNLLSNAYKYTPPADRRIEVVLGMRQGRVALAVDDNGPGIPRRERRRIFEQFYRSGDLLTRDVEGTGLGLSIALSIVRAHGGRIFVEDGVLGGSRFLVLLPVAPGTRPTRSEKER